jgi:hypothetical protein
MSKSHTAVTVTALSRPGQHFYDFISEKTFGEILHWS